jgi:hypothetical protein
MSIPALSLGGHDRYTPDIRDRILEKLQAAPVDETVYQMLTPARLRTLSEIKSADEPALVSIFSWVPSDGWAAPGIHSSRASATRP